MNVILAFIIAYLVGSIPTAIWVSKIIRGIDIRDHGSGNAGATNVFRVMGYKLGLLVLLIDMLKGFIPVYFLPLYLTYEVSYSSIIYPLGIGLFTIVGHMFTLYASFRGGKGVGTAAGVFAAIIPYSLITAVLFFVVIFFVFRIVSLSSILAAITVIFTVKLYAIMDIQPLSFNDQALIAFICLLVVFRHKGNIRRLLKGQEKKIHFTKKEPQ
jgi:glycerol-3-phosphate acyltransferase PlsY